MFYFPTQLTKPPDNEYKRKSEFIFKYIQIISKYSRGILSLFLDVEMLQIVFLKTALVLVAYDFFAYAEFYTKQFGTPAMELTYVIGYSYRLYRIDSG